MKIRCEAGLTGCRSGGSDGSSKTEMPFSRLQTGRLRPLRAIAASCILRIVQYAMADLRGETKTTAFTRDRETARRLRQQARHVGRGGHPEHGGLLRAMFPCISPDARSYESVGVGGWVTGPRGLSVSRPSGLVFVARTLFPRVGMMDIVFVSATCAFFAIAIAYVWGCTRL